MKILITTHCFYPSIGGIETIAEVLSTSFWKSGHQLVVTTQTRGNLEEDKLRYPFTVIRSPSLSQLISAYRWSDIVFQNNLSIRQLWPIYLVNRPLCISIHTWIRSSSGKKSLMQFLKRLALIRADLVVSVSDAIRNHLDVRSHVIGNPYRNNIFHLIPQISRSQSIVFLGRLVSDKGTDMLLNAFSALNNPNWKLTIIGDGPERQNLSRQCINLGIHKSVNFSGKLSGNDLACALNQHEIMVVPSLWEEPFGLVALEGMACGNVVLASDGGGLPDAVGSAGLLFQRGDQFDLTKKLRLLVEDNNLRDHFREIIPMHLNSFQPDKVCSRYLNLLEHLV